MKPVADLAPDFVRQQTEEAVIERPLSEIDRCPICKGAGWLQSDVPLGHPMFGRLIKCSCQREIEARDNARSMRQISRLAGVGGKSIASFETETQEQARAKSIAEAYARDPRGWLVFSGNCGTGKTHLAAGIANDYMERSGRTVIFAVVPDLLDHLRRHSTRPAASVMTSVSPKSVTATCSSSMTLVPKCDAVGPRKALSDHQSPLQPGASHHFHDQPAGCGD